MRIFCFGDSNTFGYDPCGTLDRRYSRQERWVDLLADALGCEVINAGQNGREIPWRESEVNIFRELLASCNPVDLLIIMLGTNDLLRGNSVDAVVQRMEAFLEQIPLDRSQILLLCPPPMAFGDWVPTQELIDASLALSCSNQNLAERCGVRFADAGEWNISLAFDGVHFTQEGHKAFARGLANFLNEGK